MSTTHSFLKPTRKSRAGFLTPLFDNFIPFLSALIVMGTGIAVPHHNQG